MKTEILGTKNTSRRYFLKATLGGTAGLVWLPSIIPSRLLGADAPGKKINVAQIGCGRMGRSDMGNVLTESLARVVAVCDLDSHRLAAGKKMAEQYYVNRGETSPSIRPHHDFRDILASSDIDAVVITGFENDDAANLLRTRKARASEYDCEIALKNAGIA